MHILSLDGLPIAIVDEESARLLTYHSQHGQELGTLVEPLTITLKERTEPERKALATQSVIQMKIKYLSTDDANDAG